MSECTISQYVQHQLSLIPLHFFLTFFMLHYQFRVKCHNHCSFRMSIGDWGRCRRSCLRDHAFRPWCRQSLYILLVIKSTNKALHIVGGKIDQQGLASITPPMPQTIQLFVPMLQYIPKKPAETINSTTCELLSKSTSNRSPS